MTGSQPSSARVWNYLFSQPDGVELQTGEFNGDDTAEARGRELSKSKGCPVIIRRYSKPVDDWEYVTEVDERT